MHNVAVGLKHMQEMGEQYGQLKQENVIVQGGQVGIKDSLLVGGDGLNKLYAERGVAYYGGNQQTKQF